MKQTIFILLVIFALACTNKKPQTMEANDDIRLVVLNPGHFHASLVQKVMYPGIDSNVYVYAPEGMEVEDYLNRVGDYNSREEDPTSWNLHVYRGADFLEKFMEEKPGNLVVLAGNNKNKTEYIEACVRSGMNVLADKPMAIDAGDFELLKEIFELAEEQGLLVYDIMTERFEITSLLQKTFSRQENIFGQLLSGNPDEPAITKESVHHFSKTVSGKALQRPAWFFDIQQEGQAIADVGTHLVDLVLWEVFPDGVDESQNSLEIVNSLKWPTKISPTQFEKVTGLTQYPDFLAPYLSGDTLLCESNSSVDLRIEQIYARVSVEWAFEAPEGAGDTHFSIMRGSLSDLVIKQGAEENYRPELYIIKKTGDHEGLFESNIQIFLKENLEPQYPGVSCERSGPLTWRINIPNKYRSGHEAHFSEVTQQFLGYLEEGRIPQWETNQMLIKYYITTKAAEAAE